jgi:anti-sigma factor RsiW
MNGMNIETMSHEQAVSSQAAERYLLGELTQEDRQAFEGHYFDCSACFEQVKVGAQFMRHAREVLDPEPEKGWLARMLGDLRRPAPAFATAMLLLALGTGLYQHSVIADLKAPRIESRYVLAGDARGAARLLSVSRKAGLSLTVEFMRKPEFTSYQAQIVTESGKVKVSVPVPAPVTDDSVTITLPADALDAGKYSLVVYGLTQDGAKTEAGKGGFDLEFQN